MPATPRYSLPYLAYGDAPDMAEDGKTSMEAVEGRLSRVHPCTSSTRPTGTPAAFMIYETDTNLVYVSNGAGTWYPVSAAASSAASGYALYSSAANQSIPNEAATAVTFGTNNFTGSAVTKVAHGAGHKFRLEIAGFWTIVVFVRYQPASVTGERFAGLRKVSDETVIGGAGGAPPSGNPVTCAFTVKRPFAEDEEVYVAAFQNTGTSRIIEPFGTNAGLTNITFAYDRPA